MSFLSHWADSANEREILHTKAEEGHTGQLFAYFQNNNFITNAQQLVDQNKIYDDAVMAIIHDWQRIIDPVR